MVPDDLLCLFSAKVEETNDGYSIEVPADQVGTGLVSKGEYYRIGLYPAHEQMDSPGSEEPSELQTGHSPPVTVGGELKVEIEDIGDQGDGIARIGSGYVIFIPDAEIGDRVTIEITKARDTFAIGQVVDRH